MLSSSLLCPRSGAIALTFLLASAACGAPDLEPAAGDPSEPSVAAAGAETPAAPAATGRRALVLRDTNDRVITQLDPGMLAHIRQRLVNEGREPEAQRLGRSYDFTTGAIDARLKPAPSLVGSAGTALSAGAATINDPSYVYSCDTYVSCSGSLWWRTCIDPTYGCRPWFENGTWAGMFGYALRHMIIVDRPNTPPPGAVPPPQIFYQFSRNGSWTNLINSTGPWPSWANYQIEAFLVFIQGDSRWQVSYGAGSSYFQPSWYQYRFGSNGQIVGATGSGQPIQQFIVQVYRLEDGGPVIE